MTDKSVEMKILNGNDSSELTNRSRHHGNGDNRSSSTVEDGIEKKNTQVTMKKQIGLIQSISIIIGIIVGSGIFVSPVGILANVKSVGMSLVMWAVSGIFSGMCALCYAELGTCIPQSGGDYVYIKRAFGDFPAFICLWINFIIICPVTIAASSLIFATYVLQPIFPDCQPPTTALRLMAAVIVALVIAINCINVNWSTRFQVVTTASKLGALLVIIVIGFMYIGKGELDNFEDSFADSDTRAGSVAIAFYSGFWAFGGWSYLNFLTDELIEPNKNLPRAIIISITIVTVIYLIANIAYIAVLSPTDMLASSAVAVTFADQTIPSAAFIVPILIAISVMGGINGNSLSMSRLFMIGAEQKHLPSFMSMINVNYLTPMPSLIVILVMTLIMQSFEDIFYLIELMGFGFATVLTVVFAGQVYLRHKEPDMHRPIKLPIVLPMTLLLLLLTILALTIYQKPQESGVGVLLMVAGAPLYLLFIYWENKPAPVTRNINRTTVVLQKALNVCAQENVSNAI